MTKLVSVITPTYNAVKTLRKCVESVRLQTYPHWEHIIIDDGSTDESWLLLNELALEDSRLRITRQSNTGQAKARNAGISMARGDYIALLDSDDVALPQRLELQVAFLNAHPDIDVLGGAIINVTDRGENLGISKLSADHAILAADIYRRCPFYTSTVLARPSFFRVLGGFDDLRRAQDYDLWLRGYRHFRYHNLQEPLVYYRRNTRPNWRNAMYSGYVVLKAIRRDEKPPYYFWYAMRPLIATFFSKIKLRDISI
ncbi:MAG: hypothetical protein B1H12_08440 [Desulfobacteraceae bacterium 4484_190.2]|nr:MAG: hypothetical protein B1H12_08440 [Desulfobacteraceae bacterium 4484_190.2]